MMKLEKLSNKQMRFWCIYQASNDFATIDGRLDLAKKYWDFIEFGQIEETGKLFPSENKEEIKPENNEIENKSEDLPNFIDLYQLLERAYLLNINSTEYGSIKADEFLIPEEFGDTDKKSLKKMIDNVNKANIRYKPELSYSIPLIFFNKEDWFTKYNIKPENLIISDNDTEDVKLQKTYISSLLEYNNKQNENPDLQNN